MNWNLKLLPAALLVAMLALAGCGGGSDPAPEPEPTPEEKCLAGDGVVYEDGVCKTAEDLRKEGRDEEADKRDKEDADKKAEAEAAAAQKMAKALLDVLEDRTTSGADVYFVASRPTDLKSKHAYKEMTVSVMGEAFNKKYKSELAASPDGSVKIGTETDDVSVANAKADAFSKAGTKTHTGKQVGGASTYQFETPGSYHGVNGTFTCTATAANGCTSSISTNGSLNLPAGGIASATWVFKPFSPSMKVTDGSAVEYGWWTDDLDKADPGAQVFYGPKDLTAGQSDPSGYGGKATYKGDAVGQYAIHRGVGGANDSGAFTAKATLNATFGSSASITGMIDGFMGADGKSRDWTVTLQKANLGQNGTWAPDTASTPPVPAMTVWTMGGNKGTAAGSWRGSLYGGTSATAPAAAAGAFQAEYDNIGNMIGAFGADKEE